MKYKKKRKTYQQQSSSRTHRIYFLHETAYFACDSCRQARQLRRPWFSVRRVYRMSLCDRRSSRQ